MKKKLISVLITNYNKSKFLTKSLSKISNQNFKDYEIILYDDASTDNSIEIIKKFKKVKLIKNKKKNQKTAPLNQINGILKSFKKSKGNIICLMDSDDFFKISKLKKINYSFNKDKNLNSLFDLPQCEKNQFIFKNKKESNSIWPTIFPTSCISIKRNFFNLFIKHLRKDEFKDLEIDARLTIFSKFYFEEYNILKTKLTTYNFDSTGITSKINIFSKKWWFRRYQAFNYMIYILNKKKKKFEKSLDYYLTTTIYLFLKFFS